MKPFAKEYLRVIMLCIFFYHVYIFCAYFHHVFIMAYPSFSPSFLFLFLNLQSLNFCDSSAVWIFGMQNVCQAKTSLPFVVVLTYTTIQCMYMYVCTYICRFDCPVNDTEDRGNCGGRRAGARLDK